MIQTKTNYNTNNQGLELKVNKFTSGQFKWAFSLAFNNGVHPPEKRDDPEMGSQCKRPV